MPNIVPSKMQFIDPFQLLRLEGMSPSEIDDAVLRQARKRLMADFELAGTGHVLVAGQQVSLAQALEVLDSMADKAVRTQYGLIHQHTMLREFLYKADPRKQRKIEALPLWSDPGFRGFVGGFLATSMGTAMAVAIQQLDWRGMLLLVRHSSMLEVAEMEVAFAPLIRLAGRWGTDLEAAAHGDNAAVQVVDKGLHADLRFMYVLNALPAQYVFLRNQYASQLEAAALSIADLQQAGIPHPMRRAMRLLGSGCYLLTDPVIFYSLEYEWVHMGMRFQPWIYRRVPRYIRPLTSPFRIRSLGGKIGTVVLMLMMSALVVFLFTVLAAISTHRR